MPFFRHCKAATELKIESPGRLIRLWGIHPKRRMRHDICHQLTCLTSSSRKCVLSFQSTRGDERSKEDLTRIIGDWNWRLSLFKMNHENGFFPLDVYNGVRVLLLRCACAASVGRVIPSSGFLLFSTKRNNGNPLEGRDGWMKRAPTTVSLLLGSGKDEASRYMTVFVSCRWRCVVSRLRMSPLTSIGRAKWGPPNPQKPLRIKRNTRSVDSVHRGCRNELRVPESLIGRHSNVENRFTYVTSMGNGS